MILSKQIVCVCVFQHAWAEAKLFQSRCMHDLTAEWRALHLLYSARCIDPILERVEASDRTWTEVQRHYADLSVAKAARARTRELHTSPPSPKGHRSAHAQALIRQFLNENGFKEENDVNCRKSSRPVLF